MIAIVNPPEPTDPLYEYAKAQTKLAWDLLEANRRLESECKELLHQIALRDMSIAALERRISGQG